MAGTAPPRLGVARRLATTGDRAAGSAATAAGAAIAVAQGIAKGVSSAESGSGTQAAMNHNR